MELYLLRHGIAADLGLNGAKRDADRPLTPEGWEKMRQQAAGMHKMGLQFDYIFTSPYRRALETTKAVTDEFEFPSEKVISLDSLAAGRPFTEGLHRRVPVFARLGAFAFDRALIVGHMPDLSEMASVLLTGAGGMYIEFKKGSICAIEISSLPPRSSGILLWNMTPKQLRMLA